MEDGSGNAEGDMSAIFLGPADPAHVTRATSAAGRSGDVVKACTPMMSAPAAVRGAILRANHTIGFTIDEHWVTLVAPSQQ